jgi:dCMP deaminase
MQKRKRPSFIENAIKVAYQIADRSEDPYKQVGAVGIDTEGNYVSNGYNGAPPGVEINWEDRDGRRKYVVHSELNALLRAPRNSIDTLVCTMIPCHNCLMACKAHGVKKIVYVEFYSSETYGETQETHKMAEQIGIELVQWEKQDERL